MTKPFTFLWAIRKRLTLTWGLLRDRRIPLWQKTIPFLPLIYILSPFNFLTFAIPVLGQIDDVFLIIFALDVFERVVRDDILLEHRPPVE